MAHPPGENVLLAKEKKDEMVEIEVRKSRSQVKKLPYATAAGQ